MLLMIGFRLRLHWLLLVATQPMPVAAAAETPTWNTSPLVPDFPEGEDDIPF